MLHRFDLPPHEFENEFMRPTGLKLLYHKQSEDMLYQFSLELRLDSLFA